MLPHEEPEQALSLEFDEVTFAYADEDPPVAVIDDVAFRLEAGTTVGVLGRTGSGKTTMARLLLRLVDPTAGGNPVTLEVDACRKLFEQAASGELAR